MFRPFQRRDGNPKDTYSEDAQPQRQYNSDTTRGRKHLTPIDGVGRLLRNISRSHHRFRKPEFIPVGLCLVSKFASKELLASLAHVLIAPDAKNRSKRADLKAMRRNAGIPAEERKERKRQSNSIRMPSNRPTVEEGSKEEIQEVMNMEKVGRKQRQREETDTTPSNSSNEHNTTH